MTQHFFSAVVAGSALHREPSKMKKKKNSLSFVELASLLPLSGLCAQNDERDSGSYCNCDAERADEQ